MNKKIVAGIAAVTLIVGGIAAEDIATADVVATLNDPISLGEAMKFHAPSHSVEVSDNGLIEIVVGGEKRYGIIPSEAAGKEKGLLLNVEHAKEVTIKEAFGAGSEIILKNTPRSFSKVVSFTEDFLKHIPKDAEYVEVSFDLSGWNVPDGTYTERIQLQQDVWLEKALAWDSSEGDLNQNYTDVEFVIENGTLTKRIPVEWLKTATFPIYTDATFTFGTKELFDTGVVGTIDVLPIGTDKAAICWTDNADTSVEGQCLVATISGTDITFGSISDFSTDIIGTNSGGLGACPAGDDRWVLVFPDDADSDDGTARVASSTGTTINGYGTAFDFHNGVDTRTPDCAYISTDKIIIGYFDNSNDDFEVVACDIATDYTLTCGTTEVLRLNASVTNADTACEVLDTNKFICMYEAQEGTVGRWLTAGTVSGTTITLGTEIPVLTGTITDDLGHSIISPLTDSFSIQYTAQTQGSPVSFALGTVSGTTITLGATTTPIIATTTSFTSLTNVDTNSAFLFYQQGATDAATTFLAAIPIELNFGALTFSTSSAETVDATTDPGSLHAAQISTCKFLFAWEDDNDTNDLFSIIGDIVGCGAAATTPKMIILPRTIINGKMMIP
jgi:hypothetical protein